MRDASFRRLRDVVLAVGAWNCNGGGYLKSVMTLSTSYMLGVVELQYTTAIAVLSYTRVLQVYGGWRKSFTN